jgi:hypothetical protein
MKDLNGYSDKELSLRVFNEKYFYIERNYNGNSNYLMALINEEFYYTEEQMKVLEEDLLCDYVKS